MSVPGRIVVLNGAPRSGKSSIAAALIAFEPGWLGLGVDEDMSATPPEHLPGIGLRPGGAWGRSRAEKSRHRWSGGKQPYMTPAFMTSR